MQYDYKNLKSVGENVFISANVEIRRPHLITLGNHIAIDTGFYCTTQVIMGDYIHVGPYVTCIGGEAGLLECKGFNNIMAGSRIICSSDRFDGSGLFGTMIPNQYKGRQMTKPVIIEEFANVGTNAIVLPGSKLRRGVLLTAGSLLIGDTEEWGIYKGNPAKLDKKIDPTRTLEQATNLGFKI